MRSKLIYEYTVKQWHENGTYIGSFKTLDQKYAKNLASNQRGRGRRVLITKKVIGQTISQAQEMKNRREWDKRYEDDD